MEPNRLAVKSLTASDLTLFEWQFRNRNAGNQKAINLNANVFIDDLYPSLPETPVGRTGRIPLDLYLYGPGHQGELNLQRKIIKIGTYKNWRLDGEFISNPLDAPTRFDALTPDDVAVFSFTGSLYPISARVAFLARNVAEDQSLHGAMVSFLAGRSMASLSMSDLNALIEAAKPGADHPVTDLALDADIEEAALGSTQATRKLLRRRQVRRISREELREARENAEDIGRTGEEFVYAYFARLRAEGTIRDFEWMSETNAVAPFDFRITRADGTVARVEVKSTGYDFERPMHFSTGELIAMADEEDYEVYRLSEVSRTSASLRVASTVRDVGKQILASTEKLPNGVTIDGYSVSPATMRFARAVPLTLPEEEATE